MKRNPRKLRWTKAYRKLAGKELAEDATFELERRRNRPEKYDREVVHRTVQAIKKVEGVRTARQARFTTERRARAKELEKAADRRQLEAEIHLVRAPDALQKDRAAKLKGEKKERGRREGGGGGRWCRWRWCLAVLLVPVVEVIEDGRPGVGEERAMLPRR